MSLWIASSIMAGSQRTSFKADKSVSRSIGILNSTKVNTEKDNSCDYNCGAGGAVTLYNLISLVLILNCVKK